MKTNVRTNTPLIILGAVAILAIIAFAVFEILHISDTSASIVAEERAYDANKDRLDQLMLIAKNEDEYRSAIEFMYRLIPAEAEDYDIMEKFDELTQRLGTDIIKIEFSDRVVNNNMNVMPLVFSTKGSYSCLIKLVEYIASCDRLMRIDEINLSQSEGSVSADINARAFYR